MSADDTEAKVRAILAEIMRSDVSWLGLDDDLVEQLGLDSLQGLQMLDRMEKRFDVRFADDRLAELRTIRRLTDAIRTAKEECGT